MKAGENAAAAKRQRWRNGERRLALMKNIRREMKA